jgi:Tol biopolymer transport system component
VIGIRSVETGEVRELSPPLKGLGVYGGVSWSPDGQSFIAVGQDTKGRSGIFRIDAHTGVTSAVITRDRAATVTMPLQSPDQKSLYYNDAGRALMKRDLNSGAETELMRPAGRLNGLSLSPDGRYIAVMVSDPSTKANALLVTTSAGGDTRELLRRAAPERPNVYTWAPDSRSILVRMLSTETSFEIWRVPVDGSHPVKLDAMLEAAIRSVRLHPDGQQIAFQVDNPTKPAEVWLTENMIPPARRGK